MHRLPLQWSVAGLLILVAGVALNVWLFRFGTLLGLLGLSVTKHLVIAWLCQVLGVDRRNRELGAVDAKPGVSATPGPIGSPRSTRQAIG